MLIYIAGKYSDTTKEKIEKNVALAIDVGNLLLDKNHFPYIPHFSHLLHIRKHRSHKFWLSCDEKWLRLCDAIFLLENWRDSKGAEIELEYAKKLGLKIFDNLADVPDGKDDKGNEIFIPDPKKYFIIVESAKGSGFTEFIEVKGSPVKIKGFEDMDLFIYRCLKTKSSWVISEGKTGRRIVPEGIKTQREARIQVKKELDLHKKEIEIVLNSYIDDKLSPRYKKTNTAEERRVK